MADVGRERLPEPGVIGFDAGVARRACGRVGEDFWRVSGVMGESVGCCCGVGGSGVAAVVEFCDILRMFSGRVISIVGVVGEAGRGGNGGYRGAAFGDHPR